LFYVLLTVHLDTSV